MIHLVVVLQLDFQMDNLVVINLVNNNLKKIYTFWSKNYMFLQQHYSPNLLPPGDSSKNSTIVQPQDGLFTAILTVNI